MIIDNVPEQMSEDDVIELANEFTEYLENSGNLFFHHRHSPMFCYNKGTKLKIHRNQKGKGNEEA